MTFEIPSVADDSPPVPTATIDDALGAFGWTRRGVPEPVAESVLNQNYRVETDAGPRFVRFAKLRATRQLIEAEHRLIAWAGEHGIPVCRPFATPGGRTVVGGRGAFIAVFPWVDHQPLLRGQLSMRQAAVLGELHGRVQLALREYHDPVLEARPRSEVEWDTGASIAALSRIDDVIRYYPSPSDDRLQAQLWLREQMALLESGLPRSPRDFDGLPEQLVHGDFHERNVLLGPEDAVIAVVDWERARVNPRAFHLVRALDFMGLREDEGRIAAYAGAFGQHVRLSSAECEAAVEQWWQSALHNTWAFTDVFIRGHDEVRRFLPEIVPRLQRLSDPEYRAWLAEVIARAVGEED